MTTAIRRRNVNHEGDVSRHLGRRAGRGLRSLAGANERHARIADLASDVRQGIAGVADPVRQAQPPEPAARSRGAVLSGQWCRRFVGCHTCRAFSGRRNRACERTAILPAMCGWAGSTSGIRSMARNKRLPAEGRNRGHEASTDRRPGSDLAYNHSMPSGRCFRSFMRVIAPDDSCQPRGLPKPNSSRSCGTALICACSKPSPPKIGTVARSAYSRCSRSAGCRSQTLTLTCCRPCREPTYQQMTDAELKAIYAYTELAAAEPRLQRGAERLRRFPPFRGWRASRGPYYSGPSLERTEYIYPNTDDCPNNVIPG